MHIPRRALFSALALALTGAGAARFALAGKAPVFSDGDGAIRGYDPVAYVEQGKAVKGSKDHSTTWKGATWRFSSAANLAAFEKSPKAFAPQYGGYCAYAMADGRFASTDPRAFTVVDGKLYLNYSPSIQDRWRKKRDAYIESANKNWARLDPRG